MSSKRKSEPTKKSVKRNKSKVEDDYESDLSDDGQNNAIVTEVLLQPHEEMEMLPEPLLKTFDKEPGRLLIAGMVTWDMTGRKTSAKGVMKIRPNLYTFHRFTTDMYRSAVSGCSSAHSVLINMNRKALAFGRNQHGQLDFACGNNHSVAIDSKNRAFSWGFGGIGRLGHAEQKDEMNAALQATAEELSKTIAELAAAKPASTPAAFVSEVSALREQNQALSAEVAALRETTVTLPSCESQPGAQSPLSSELAKAQQEILILREELKGLKEEKAKWESEPKSGKSGKTGKNNGKNQQSQKPKQAKGGVKNADPKPAVPITPSGSKEVGTSPDGESQGDNPGDESGEGNANDDFKVVNRRKPRSKHKPRRRNEAIEIKTDEKSYATLLRNLRSNEEFKELGDATKSVRRTRQNELLLILKRGTKPSSEYARLVTESVGSDKIKVRSLCSETTLLCKNLDETATAEDLLDAITTQCLTGTLSVPVQLRKYNQSTLTATFKLPGKIAAMVLKVGKIKVNCHGAGSSKKLEVIRVNEARSSDGVVNDRVNVVKVKQEYHRTEVASLRDTRCGFDVIGKCVSDSHPQRTSR
ncbi:hypothetical protein quinque_008835 [Culex quinquefasciatus]